MCLAYRLRTFCWLARSLYGKLYTVSSRRHDTRERILEAAFQLAQAGRFATMAEIARAADVSRQAVYLHFGSRAGLMKALFVFINHKYGLGEKIEKAFPHSRRGRAVFGHR
ncbi:MAG: TetR/AcrR family transcriptional regulator [Candidatus Dadabacteria bacterium]|nr:MAG: TetR/AcrR family transcriptional regulator [Candidatus Dadabacteria bacterium]